MPRKTARKGKHKCPKCGQTFAMAMHLGRHMTARHGGGSGGKPAGRARRGRPPGKTSLPDFRSMPADELIALLNAAQEEANRRLEGLQQAAR